MKRKADYRSRDHLMVAQAWARVKWGPGATIHDVEDPNVARSGPVSPRYYVTAYPVTGYDGQAEFTSTAIVAVADTLDGLFLDAALTGRGPQDSEEGLRVLLGGFAEQRLVRE